MDDRELVALFLKRSEDAIPEAKRRYEAYALSVARRFCADERDAEECWNDALLSAWNSIPPQCPQNLKTYLAKLVREAAIDRLRRLRAQKRIAPGCLVSIDELEEAVGESRVEDAVEAAELARAISDFLRSCRETERALFIRRYWYCESIAEIREHTGFGKSKILMTLKRTRDRLAAYLRKEGYLI